MILDVMSKAQCSKAWVMPTVIAGREDSSLDARHFVFAVMSIMRYDIDTRGRDLVAWFVFGRHKGKLSPAVLKNRC